MKYFSTKSPVGIIGIMVVFVIGYAFVLPKAKEKGWL
jgi:hypothetical protein